MVSPIDELAPYVLTEVEGLDTGDRKGAGAYGAVFEVTVKGVSCIAKRVHAILVDQEVSQRQKAAVRETFHQECVMLSKLTHPNIVHFVGVHHGTHPGDLSLIMERMHVNLAKCVENHPNIPLPVKLAILLDVSYGLLYLHTHTPPIIHRDLTASNILLTTDMRAKIADLGVSKLLDIHTQVTHAQTTAPGTLYYMPPEALREKPIYDMKLDIFSFGHLTLYTVTQEFPKVHEVTITPLVLQEGTLQIHRRWTAIDQMGEEHCLYPLAIQCLQDKPEKRPTTAELNKMLKELCARHPKCLADVMEVCGNVSN